MRITFLGAAGTVTGSKYLLEVSDKKILIDCGMFQGLKPLRLMNWEPFPVNPGLIDCVILTHAHIDHSGYLPVLARQGFRGPVYATAATRDLCEVMLKDAAHLQVEDALYASKKGFSKHKKPEPLFDMTDAEQVLSQFVCFDFNQSTVLLETVTLTFHMAGHILGASIVQLDTPEGRIVFSGDLGRPDDVLMYPPQILSETDYLVCESTYGNRLHGQDNPADMLKEVIQDIYQHKGVLIVPAFSVGRTQHLLYLIYQLKQAGVISKKIPVYINSPMATKATELFVRYHDYHRLSLKDCEAAFNDVTFVGSLEESKALQYKKGPMILIAGSGMATGGRVIHHIKEFGVNAKNHILFAGYQAPGTRGWDLVQGKRDIRIHGQVVAVKAQVNNLPNISAHADYEEIVDWLRCFKKTPARIFLTHGEPDSSQALADHIASTLGWACSVPVQGESVVLS